MRQYPEREIRTNFGYMAQDAVLFDDTLHANLCYGLEGVSQDRFDKAVAVSGVRDFAARHPDGYGMRVGPRGERLSGGERQAVALARALMAEPGTLILDEPTAAMDSTAETRLVRELGPVLAGRTLILSTHRAPLLALVDRLLWIEDGRVIADGPKAAVLARIQSGLPST
jgi:ATP-binding cassette subfamily C protein LapB